MDFMKSSSTCRAMIFETPFFSLPILKAGLDGIDATVVDRFVGAAVFADLLVVAGAPALQIEDRDVVVPNRGLRLRQGRR
jgi:hypothetical protein